MKTKFFITLLFTLATVVGVSATALSKEKMIGVWQFNDSELPSGYNRGVVAIGESNGKVVVNVVIDGYAIAASSASIVGKKGSFTVEVDGATVDVAFEPAPNGLVAKTNFDGSSVTVNCSRFDLAKSLEGTKWSVVSNDAPAGYERSVVEFSKGTMRVLMGGSQMDVSNFKIHGAKITCVVSIDGESIPVSMEWRGNTINGVSTYNGSPMKFSATKQ